MDTSKNEGIRYNPQEIQKRKNHRVKNTEHLAKYCHSRNRKKRENEVPEQSDYVAECQKQEFSVPRPVQLENKGNE